MDIKDILDKLGLDLKDPEAKRGALEAIDAILASRSSEMSGGNGGLGGMSNETEIELDPDLILPSQKHQPKSGPDQDIEIEDEDDVLSQIKQNQSEEPTENNSDESSETSSESENSAEKDIDGDTDAANEEDNEDTTSAEQSPESDSLSDETDADDSEELADSSDDENSEISDNSEETDEDEFDEEASEESDEDEFDEDEFDENDFMDDELKNAYDDEETKSKHDSRKIKRERTLHAARAALEKAKAKNVSASLITELEKSIAALEALTEAANKSIKDISDTEFNALINRVFDAIEAIGDSDLTYKTEHERELQAQEIKNDLASETTRQELSAEDVAKIRAEHQATKAREKESQKYKARARNSFKGFQEFLSSLYRAIALQVQVNEIQDDSWAAINRRHSGTNVLQPGKRINELPDKRIPIIDFYFDQSGSWSEADLAIGQKAVSQLVDMEEKGQIKINIYYFANNVFSDAASARAEGGTRAWNEIVKNVIKTQATNVVIMTDSDMEDWWSGTNALSYTVPGYVWYLWRNGENAPRLPRDLKGRGGTQQFSFSTY
jgi:hypothetical protein